MKINSKTLMGLFIIGIMVFSVFGFLLSYGSDQQVVRYGDYKFTRTSLGVQTKINGERVIFNYDPLQVEGLPIDDQAKTTLKNTKALFLTYDPNHEWATAFAEIQYYLEQAIPQFTDVYVERGLTNSTGFDIKKITCSDATESQPVLLLSQSNQTEITFEDNCITASAEQIHDLLRINDKVQFLMYGVME